MSRIATATLMTLREVVRSPMSVTLLFVIPVVFFAVVYYTSATDPIRFMLPAVSDDTALQVSQRDESLVVIATAAVGFLSAFLAMTLVQRNLSANRRLILCGYRAPQLLLAKSLVLLLIASVVSLFVALLLRFLFEPTRFGIVWLGLLGIGLVYGCYGMLVGALARRDLAGILFVILLANIDAGWLQNPVYYSSAPDSTFIRALPAFFPTQTAIIGAFTNHDVARALTWTAAYALALWILAGAALAWRLRVQRTLMKK